jgi:fumarylacetoacetase
MINETHSPELKSWVESANRPDTDFPIQNLPHAVFRRRGSHDRFRGGVAIGDMILDMAGAAELGVFGGIAADAAECAGGTSLNRLMAMGPQAWSSLRLALSRLLRESASEAGRLRPWLVPQAEAEYAVPVSIGDYTDFFTSFNHMMNAGRVFSPDAPMLPNFKWLPIGYHGRASTVDISGAAFARPLGQARAPDAAAPVFGPSRRIDYELELGAFIGPGNRRGQRIGIDDAEKHVFGVCLLNDWSARDVQAWEAVPLGPFLSKSFLTTISPWIVTLEALEPYRTALPRESGDPEMLPCLRPSDPAAQSGFDIQLEAWLSTARSNGEAMRLSRSSYRHAYWGLAQMVAHHAENGCSLRPGDLLGTGTQSGPEPGEEGCLLELSRAGKQPIALPNGESRGFLEDGDTVILRGLCERAGYARIGFGECRGTVLPADAL